MHCRKTQLRAKNQELIAVGLNSLMIQDEMYNYHLLLSIQNYRETDILFAWFKA